MDKDDKSPKPEKLTKNNGETGEQSQPKPEKQPNKKTKVDFKDKKVIFPILGAIVLVVVIFVIVLNHKSYEEYDLKDLTVKEACEKARGAGWKVGSIHHIESYSDTTDCYNEKLTVSDYDYWDSNKSVEIMYGKEGEKKAECEASGKWYRDNQCKSQEEWENDYAWKNAHAACKKYGSSGYAKTLTDCYVGNEYKGPVDGEATSNTPSSEPSSSESSNTSSTNWRQVLSEYEAWFNKYIDFMIKYNNTTDSSAKMSMLEDYSKLLSEMTEWTEKLDGLKDDMSASDVNEYLQTINRINQRLNELY